MSYTPRLKTKYREEIVAKLHEQFSYKSVMQVPRLEKICINQGVGGAIMKMDKMIPSKDGSTIYLNGGEDLNVALNKVIAAGGEVFIPKMAIGENGFIAQFIDTEGNRVALHSMN